ncbi:MAG: dGTP triphosphohydrolase [Verrucomicrobiota bacterium]
MPNTFYNAFDVERPGRQRPSSGEDYRSPFQIDRDRIIHSAAFRQLQSKTQVFFSGEYDFYRTRLTHSIEVAQIGRSLAARLNQVTPGLSPERQIDSDLVEAVCLAHDLGHPPFGHAGERTLHRLMKPYGGFEGNAQTLRLLASTLFNPSRGMNPTRALIDGVLKYKTLFEEVPDQRHHYIYQDQAGWLEFVTGKKPFPDSLTPGKARNAFKSIECQIMDWADDTAYSLNDISDGIEAGFITIDKIERWAEAGDMSEDDSASIDALIEAMRDDQVEAFVGREIGQFIAAASLEADDRFLADQSERHRWSLVVSPMVKSRCKLFKKLSYELVFQTRQLQQLERKSDFILTRLFETFGDLYIAQSKPGRDHFRLLPEAEESLILAEPEEAKRARMICDHLARLTDGLASRTYKRLFDADYGSILDLV